MKRMISLLLVVAMLLSMMTGFAQAASSEEEAMSEIPIYNGGQSLNCLTVNGRVQEFNYVYYNFNSNVTFQIFKDGEPFDTKETNQMGEIVLRNLQPGTYRVVVPLAYIA